MRKGFTLIELLVVVLIMGILASVAMPQYFKSVEKSRATEAVDALSAIASAQERYYMQKGTYTQDLSQLDIGLSNLDYFTLHLNQAMYENEGKLRIAMNRKKAAAGGLGKYRIHIQMPKTPGTGKRSWLCSPSTAGCGAFLPINKYNNEVVAE